MYLKHQIELHEKAVEILQLWKEATGRRERRESLANVIRNAKPGAWHTDTRLVFAPPLWKAEWDADVAARAEAYWMRRYSRIVTEIETNLFRHRNHVAAMQLKKEMEAA
jgi:hypothetical protein